MTTTGVSTTQTLTTVRSSAITSSTKSTKTKYTTGRYTITTPTRGKYTTRGHATAATTGESTKVMSAVPKPGTFPATTTSAISYATGILDTEAGRILT